MREIKFRAWDTRLNEWLGTPFFINPENGKVHEWADTGLEGYDIPSAILMQYTGLKDKNGTEIYEGDIIRFGSARETFLPLEPSETTASVVYTYGSFNAAGNTLGEVTDWHECEVIGNIYENKELLA